MIRVRVSTVLGFVAGVVAGMAYLYAGLPMV